MNPARRRRLLWVLGLVAAAGVATALVATALQRNIAYLYTPSEVLRGDAGDAKRFRQLSHRQQNALVALIAHDAELASEQA